MYNARKELSLKYKIMIFSITLVTFILIISALIVINDIVSNVHTSISNRALAIGRVIARVDDVQNGIQLQNPTKVLQPIAEEWRQATGAGYIVISNMNEIRLSHPDVASIGTPMVNINRDPVLHGQEYVTIAKGVLAPSLRAYVPIFDIRGDTQIGFVSVGFFLDDIADAAQKSATRVAYVFLLAIGLCAVGAVALAHNVKKAIHGLEPYEIAHILREHTATLKSIREGIITVDSAGSIRLINDGACNILGISRHEAKGKLIDELLPDKKLRNMLIAGHIISDEELVIKDITIMASAVPMTVGNQVVGAVVSFRDRTEIVSLAEEITGVRRFVEVMRAQAHEYKNKLHVIAGLIQLGRNDEAVDYIMDSCLQDHDMYHKLSARIKDSITFGLLVGKSSRMRELGIQFDIRPESKLAELPKNFTSGDMVLVLGNLMENAIEAVNKCSEKRIELLLLEDRKGLTLKVWNSGPWIAENLGDTIYRKGTTTKGEKRGFGLALVKEKVEINGGSITHTNVPSGGVTFNVFIPNRREVSNE